MASKIATPAKPANAKPANAKPAGAVNANGAADGPANGDAEKIRLLAYQKWEAAGKPDCDGLSYWLEAEREVCQA